MGEFLRPLWIPFFSESIASEKPNMFSKAWKHSGHWSVVRVTYRQNFKDVIDLVSLFWINIILKDKAYNDRLARYTVISHDENVSGFPCQCTLPDSGGNTHRNEIQPPCFYGCQHALKHIKSTPHCTWVSVLSWQRDGVRQVTIQDRDECSRL